jgi:hypothetical protein
MLLGGCQIKKMTRDPLPHRAKRADRGLLQRLTQAAVQLHSNGPPHPADRAVPPRVSTWELIACSPTSAGPPIRNRDSAHYCQPSVRRTADGLLGADGGDATSSKAACRFGVTRAATHLRLDGTLFCREGMSHD